MGEETSEGARSSLFVRRVSMVCDFDVFRHDITYIVYEVMCLLHMRLYV